MILTCPDCATSYFVDDGRIPPRGRTVRCSNCGARWRALPDGAPDPDDMPPAADAAPPELDAPTVTAPEDDFEFVAAPLTPGRRARTARKPRVALVAAAAVAVLLAALVGTAVVLRHQVASRVPATAPLFAAIGLPVDTGGLVIEGVAFEPTFEAGRPVLAVTGAVRNVRAVAANSPPIRVSVLDKAGRPMLSGVFHAINGEVPGHAKRYFAVTLPEPPAGIRQLEVRFDQRREPGGAASAASVDHSTQTTPET